jgi:hypothetical protein
MRRGRNGRIDWYDSEDGNFAVGGEEVWDPEAGTWARSSAPTEKRSAARPVPAEFQTTPMPTQPAPSAAEMGFLESKVDPKEPPAPRRESAFTVAPTGGKSVVTRAMDFGTSGRAAFSADPDKSFKSDV